MFFGESPEAVITLVKAGFGLAVMPRLLTPPDPELVLRPLAGVEPLSFGMYYKSRRATRWRRQLVGRTRRNPSGQEEEK
ncbi:LysR substrate-binding domain-containing protein [Allofournierella massiliensis]|uniref:LysR substrate-binding domain-containing protein n=1 Tax=Allofournierella massiliensis TaxID=1650663 RepID=UPI0024B0F07C|nr:LysR substrate-binding domain-containing protein [Fournierella massiliensis]